MKSFRSSNRYVITLLLPLLISGCKTIKIREKIRMPSSRKRTLPHLDAFTCDHQQTNSGVTIRIKTLRTQQECIKLFGKNGKNLLKKKKKAVFPVHVTLENKTDSTWMLPPENVGLNLVPERLIARRVGYWTGIRSFLTGGFLFGSAGALGWASTPLGPFIMYGGPLISSVALCALAPIGAAVAALAVAAPLAIMVHGIKSRNANKQISKMMSRASLLNRALKVAPRDTHSLLFFVRKKDYKRRFVVVMTDGQDDVLLFNIHAPAI